MYLVETGCGVVWCGVVYVQQDGI